MKITDIINQIGLIGIYKIFHPNTKEYTFFSATYESPKIDHRVCHKASLKRYKKIEIIPCILSDHANLSCTSAKIETPESLDLMKIKQLSTQ
jgi:exonuclease III